MNSYLFPALEKAPAAFAMIAKQIRADRMDVPTHPDRFTPRQVFAHMADWEPILRDERLREAVRSPGCEVNAYDEGERAAERDYDSLDPEGQLALWADEREKTITFLRGLTPEQWTSEMHHPERGRMTVTDLANAMIGHDMYHVEQLLTAL